MAALDQVLLLVEAQEAGRGDAAGEVGGERVDAVGARRLGDRLLVAREGEGGALAADAGVDLDQPSIPSCRIVATRLSTWALVL